MLSISGLPSSFLCSDLSSAQYSSSHLSLPSPCNKSQPFYNPLGAVHNYPGSNCRSIYIRQCRGLASLMEVCVSSECIFYDLTAWAQVLLGLIDVRLSLSGLAWVCSIKQAFAKSGQSNKLRTCWGRKELQLTRWLFSCGYVAFWQLRIWRRDRETCQGRCAYSSAEKNHGELWLAVASVTSWNGLMHEGRGAVRAATHLAARGSLWVLIFYPQHKMHGSSYQYPDKTF